jgi:hypothetical protein
MSYKTTNKSKMMAMVGAECYNSVREQKYYPGSLIQNVHYLPNCCLDGPSSTCHLYAILN